MQPKPRNFKDEFRARLDKIEAKAKLAGINWTVLCKEAGLSRATPVRWQKKVPQTVEIVAKLESLVDEHAAKAGQSS